jgi:glycosyltransferase involved in cell wall biosynthesis
VNIAVFTDTYRPQINGVVTSIDSFRKELERQGHRVVIFCPSYSGREVKEKNVYRFFSIAYRSEMMREQRIVFPLSRALFLFPFFDFDIVHFHVTHYLGAYGLIFAWLKRIPAVHTCHTLFVKYTHYVKLRKSLTVKAVKLLTRRFSNHGVRVIAPSPEMKAELSTYGIKVPIDVIPTGIDNSSGRPLPDKKALSRLYRFPLDKKLLIFVGRFAKEKNITFLFDVLEDLIREQNIYHLILVGSGPQRPDLETEVSERGISSVTTITGYIPRETVLDLLTVSDLLVFPSETETQGLVLLESMSVGTPVVAVDAMGAGDVLRDGRGGIAVVPGKKDFLHAVKSLLFDEELYARKKRECFAKAAEWSAEIMTEKLVCFYEKAIVDYRRRRLGR